MKFAAVLTLTLATLGCGASTAVTITNTTRNCGESDLGPGNYWREIHSGGRQRSYKVHVPPGYNKNRPVPLVVSFHGGGANAENQEKGSQMNNLSDSQGFIVVYPNGTGGLLGRLLTFNAGTCCGYAKEHNVDDVGFTRDLLDDIERHFCIDPKRVYATGFSNGAIMAYALGCELANRVAAIAPVGGPIGLDKCNPARPVPVLHIHGTADRYAPYQGGMSKGLVGEKNLFKSVPDTISTWVRLNRCTGQPKATLKKGAVVCETWNQCVSRASVTLCRIEGGGHTWPGGAGGLEGILGPTNRDISATEMIWEFFRSYSLP